MRFARFALVVVVVGSVVCVAGCDAAPHSSPATVERAASGAAGYAILGADVFDGHQLLRRRDVIVRGATIESLSEAGTTTPANDLERVDGRGKTLLPGLIDAHTHYTSDGGAPWGARGLPKPAAYAQMQLYAGITTALLAATGEPDLALAIEGPANKVLTPHLFPAGPAFTAPGGHPIPLLHALVPWPLDWWLIRRIPVAATPEEARAAVGRVAELKPTFFKIMYDDLPPGTPHLTPDVLRAAIDAAKQHGMRPIVHIGRPEDMVTVAEAGAALLMHPPSDGRLSEEQAERIVKTGVPFVTTVQIWSSAFRLGTKGPTALETEEVAPDALALWKVPPSGYVLPGFGTLQPEMPKMAENLAYNVKLLIDRGARFFVGTDTGVPGMSPGPALHNEIAALVGLGIDPLRVLEATTAAPAAFLDPRGSFGEVKPGARADLLLVRGDPVADVHALDAIETVFLEGRPLLRHAAHL
jgi:imidazolonepropionase-like amidohydrolase